MATTWREPICVRCFASRGDGDCGILALTSLLGWSYEDVLTVAGGLSVFPHRSGMYLTQIKKVAEILGVKLKRSKKVDFENQIGIVDMVCRANRLSNGPHVVTLRYGLFFDAEQVWQPEDFIKHYQAEIRGILIPQGE